VVARVEVMLVMEEENLLEKCENWKTEETMETERAKR